MTRKTRGLIVVVVIAVLLVGAFVVVKSGFWKTEETEPAPEIEETIRVVDLERDSLRAIAVENPAGGLRIMSADGDRWIVSDVPAVFTAKESLIRSFVANLSRIPADRIIEEDAGDFTLYALDAPEATVWITDSEGNTSVLEFGKENPAGTGRYARIPGESKVYLVPSWNSDKAFWTTSDIREDGLPGINPEAIVALTIRSDGRTLRTEPPTGDRDPYRTLISSMLVVEPWRGRYSFEDHKLPEIFAAAPLPNRVAGFVDDPPENPESLGFGADADRIVVEMGESGRVDWEIGISDGEGRRYVRDASNTGTIFLVNDGDLGILEIDPFDLTGKFVFLAGIAEVDELRIEAPEGDFSLSIERLGDPEDDGDDVYRIGGREIPEDDFKKAYQAIIGLLYEGVAQKRVNRDTPVYRIHFFHKNEDVDPITVRFWDYDREYLLGGVDGEPAEFIIGRYQLASMAESLKALEAYGS